MNEKKFAKKLIKENEYQMCNFVDHYAIEINETNHPELTTYDFNLLQQIMCEHCYCITKKTDNRRKKNKTFYLIHRATINI